MIDKSQADSSGLNRKPKDKKKKENMDDRFTKWYHTNSPYIRLFIAMGIAILVFDSQQSRKKINSIIQELNSTYHNTHVNRRNSEEAKDYAYEAYVEARSVRRAAGVKRL